MRNARGQTLPETVLFLPILLLAAFAVIYFSQLGVANERAQLGVRYGGLAAFVAQPGAFYSAQNIYQFYESASGQSVTSVCPTAPPGAYTDSAPFPGPTSAPYWKPYQIGTQSNPAPCTITVQNLGGASFLATHYFSATLVGTNATILVPNYLQSLMGSQGTVTATEAFVHTAYPAIILECTNQQVYNRAFGALFPNASPPPMPPCK